MGGKRSLRRGERALKRAVRRELREKRAKRAAQRAVRGYYATARAWLPILVHDYTAVQTALGAMSQYHEPPGSPANKAMDNLRHSLALFAEAEGETDLAARLNKETTAHDKTKETGQG